ncbi:MAG: hypothetical protein M1339_01845 [Bacteroidetes bacterium]|nr:hypothetical protein [Bacteroidota bacterium]
MKSFMLFFIFAVPLLTPSRSSARTDSTLIHLNNYSYFYGRQYYVLRSGRTQMFIQSDKVDLGSAFTYLLFDAQNARQSVRKDSACNYTATSGFQTSALEIVMGNYPFVALGQNTVTRWVYQDGIPRVEAVWWAGGIQVIEKIFAVAGMNTFVRSITLRGAAIIGNENVTLRLGVPEGNIEKFPDAILFSGAKGRIAVVVPQSDVTTRVDKNYLDIAATVAPGSEQTFNTFIVTQIPSGEMEEMVGRMGRVNTGNQFLAETRAEWARVSSVKTGDSVVQHLFDNVRFTLPGYLSDTGIMDAGVFEYGGQWIRDASNTAVGLLQIGKFRLVHNLLSYMMDRMITPDGATMISSSYEKPENEEFDQMGELWEAMKDYYYWTGDASLLKKNAAKLIAMTNRPLMPEFMDSTGMVHNKREYWERFLTDGYELAYQTWVIQGLHDAIDLAHVIDAGKYVRVWRMAKDKMLKTMLTDRKMGLVSDGALIKRRALDGDVVDTVRYKGYIIDYGAANRDGDRESEIRTREKHVERAAVALGLTLVFRRL